MAQIGFTPIKLYYSSTPTNEPLAGDLVFGELALNIADGKLFYKDAGGVVQSFSNSGGVGNFTELNVGGTGGIDGTIDIFVSSGSLGSSLYSIYDEFGTGYNNTYLDFIADDNVTLFGGIIGRQATYSELNHYITTYLSAFDNVNPGGDAWFKAASTQPGYSSYLSFTTNNSEVMRIISTGDVGIGQTAPSTVADHVTLTIGGTSSGLIFLKNENNETSFEAYVDTFLSPLPENIDAGIVARKYDGTFFGEVFFSENAYSEFNNDNQSIFMYAYDTGAAGGNSWFLARPRISGVDGYLSFGVMGTARMRLTPTGLGIGTTAPKNKLEIVGSFGRGAPVTKTADFSLLSTDNWVINNKSGSTCTVTLPSAGTWTGREFTIKTIQAQLVVSATSNVVPIDSATAGTAILAATAGKWATLVSDGTNWVIMQAN